MKHMKLQWEIDENVKYSKNGILNYINFIIDQESAENKINPEIGNLWELKLSGDNIKYYLRKGGSKVNSEKPYFRTELTFSKDHDMNKLIKAIYEHI